MQSENTSGRGGAGHDAPRRRGKPLITISIPVYNEQDNIERLLAALDALAQAEDGYAFEFLFTDNASTDETFERLAVSARRDARIRVLRLSRNFGFQRSILTNFVNARGAAAVQLDADLQDPPEMISQFLRAWEEGYKVVYGIRRRRQEFPLLRISRKLFYLLISAISDTKVPRDAGDFRLIDRVIIEHLRGVQEQSPYLRGLIAGQGYRQVGIPYDRAPRVADRSKFKFFDLIELAIDGITSQSTRPLRLITMFGILTFIGSSVLLAYYLVYYFFVAAELPSGFTTIVILLLFSVGLNGMFLGMIGEYVGRIFNNVRGLPISIIEHAIDPIPAHDAIVHWERFDENAARAQGEAK